MYKAPSRCIQDLGKEKSRPGGLWWQYGPSPKHIGKGESSTFWKHHSWFFGGATRGVLEPDYLHLRALAQRH